MTKIFLVMVGGGLGALCRYSVALAAAKVVGARFPLGTLLVNLAGCFLIGAAFAVADRTQWLGPSARLFFMTGFLGALTTFSTFALETVTSTRASTLTGVLNFLANNVGGVLLVLAGMWVVQFLLKGE
ncbi:MAG: fluoride efflux transporter CrcB [Desulfobacterales bacterium]|nr:fluoride efflux transporter CrcB [Desulfobacterales bacterium]